MSAQPPGSDDPLAALAKAAQIAVNTEEKARTAEFQARTSADAARKRLTRAVSVTAVTAVMIGALVYAGPRLLNPYYGDDPLADEPRAKAYLAGLLDAVSAYRARNSGQLPRSLDQAVAESRLPPRESAYRLEYRIEGDAPVLTLLGGREPVVVRGAGK